MSVSSNLIIPHMPIQLARHSSLLIGSWLSMMLYGRGGLQDSGSIWSVTSSIAMVTQLTNVYYLTVSFWGNAVAIQTQYWPVPVYIVANSLTGVMVHAFLIHRVYSPESYGSRSSSRTDAFDLQPTVSFWGQHRGIQREYWPVPVYIVANSLTGVMVHAFLIHRVYSLSRILWISVFLAFSVVLGFVGAIMLAVNIATAAALSSASRTKIRDKGVTAATLWAAGSATADVLIAAVLIWKLTTMRTSFKRTSSLLLIQRLVVGAVQTGSTTSTAAVATMVSYYILKNNSNDYNLPTHLIRSGGTVATAIYYLIGPLYMLTLLYNFNLRQYRDRIDINVSGSTDTRLTGPDAISMDAIHFHRTAIVSIDLPDGDASRSRVDTATKLSQYTEGGSFAAKGGRAGRADL
ncbi:hypothetical protein B0H14DRAFT_3443155 [Mycena olivaceomarginata]|nr:hypothetical protein B0H14DRAFT_3443155 [Mycena olivaceomarginata]